MPAFPFPGFHHVLIAIFAALGSLCGTSGGWECLAEEGVPERGEIRFLGELSLRMENSSNVFQDHSGREDLMVRPAAKLSMDFGRYWTIGYTGELSSYVHSSDLLSQWHEAYLFLNPSWGSSGQNQLLFEISVGYLKNLEDYRNLDTLQPGLLLSVDLGLSESLRWFGSVRGTLRRFAHDESSDTLDAWARTGLTLSLFGGWWTARAAYGYRHYPNPSDALTDRQDQQLEVGTHYSRGMWRNAELQLDYSYSHAFGPCGTLERMLTEQQLTYLGFDFLFSGHQGSVSLKQVLVEQVSIGGSVLLSSRRYNGWPAYDSAHNALGQDRRELRFGPLAYLAYSWSTPPEENPSRRSTAGFQLQYEYLQQESNSRWFAASSHLVSLSLWMAL